MIDTSLRDSWQALSDRLRPFIARRLPAEDAADVLQDVLLRIHRSAPQLDDDSRFGPWVYAIARNAVVDHLRKRRTVTVSVDEHPEIAPSISPESEPDAPLVDCIAPFVARLPAPYREAVTLVELRGLTQAAAAEVAGVSLSGMKSRVQRGRHLMREMFEDCCVLTIDVRGRVVDAEPQDESGCSEPCRPRSGT